MCVVCVYVPIKKKNAASRSEAFSYLTHILILLSLLALGRMNQKPVLIISFPIFTVGILISASVVIFELTCYKHNMVESLRVCDLLVP